ncbi:hypothetical protein [Butyrivibrio sp. FCS014]|uniref:hypothetical protein n=1 Tax=Butyrivibrio sp. FCS014 TaxID=1408304 RepID=UPI000464D496|nr:hypothetical protein [Butyrivibrio sp. FCS014]
MKILQAILFGFLGTLLAQTLIIAMYAKVPAFHDMLHDSIHSDESTPVVTREKETVNDTPSIEDLVADAVTDYPTEDDEVAIPVVNETVYKPDTPNLAVSDITVTDGDTLSIGDITKVGDFYVGLAYAKRMDYLPTALGDADVQPGNEVIIMFFDVLNAGTKRKTFWDSDLTGYADSMKVDGVETYIKVVVDGVEQYHNYDLDSGTQAMACVNYEVPKGWGELKVFYDDKVSWVVRNNQVTDDPFVFTPLIKADSTRPITNVGDVIFNGDYKITYMGHKSITDNGLFTDSYLEVFLFTIDNTSNQAIDYGLTGYNMAGYADNYFFSNPSWAYNDKVDGYINIYDIESIAPGMSANVYIAFEKRMDVKNKTLYMLYDTGYIFDNQIASVYIEE